MISTRQVQLESESASFATSNSELIVDNAKLKTEFTSRTSALEISLSVLTAENELALLQINQLQEELETTYLDAKKVNGELVAGATALETQLTRLKGENELAAVKINQLKKELGTTYSNSKELKGESAKRASALETTLIELTTENELASLQIKQLQEELSDSAALAASNSELIVDNAKLKAEFTSRTLALETDLSELKSENELALLQISQLQEELEATYLNANELKGGLAAGVSALETRLSELTAENELALLQINQLQEELEHYYIQYQKMTYSPNTEICYVTDLNRVKFSMSLMNMK
jgi:chromosome segregation ATPase